MSLVKTYYTTGGEEEGLFKTFANFESMSSQNVQTTFLHPSSKKPTLEVAKVDNFNNSKLYCYQLFIKYILIGNHRRSTQQCTRIQFTGRVIS